MNLQTYFFQPKSLCLSTNPDSDMKNTILILAFAALFAPNTWGQEKPVKFTVEVSTDSVLLGNYFEVKFILENANGQNFEAPAFEQFDVVSGPNFSTSYSMVNGEVTQSMTVTYYLEPKDIGSFYILPASVETDEKVLETTPLEVFVAPNPDGIQQNQPRRQNDFQFRLGDPFNLDWSFPEMPELRRINPQELPPPPPPPPPAEETPKKKKRKTVRI